MNHVPNKQPRSSAAHEPPPLLAANDQPSSPQDRVLRIAQHKHLKSMRHLTGAKAYDSMAMPAVKSHGRVIYTEAGVELVFYMHAEFDPSVVHIRSQPARFDMIVDGKEASYFPDAAVLRASGHREIIEIKSDHRHLKDPKYAAKLALAKEACAMAGFGFRVLTREEICSPTARRNIEHLFVNRFTTVLERHKAIVNHLLRDGAVSHDDLIQALGAGPVHGKAVVSAMIARRIVSIDLNKPLNGHSRVTAVPPLPDYLPPLAF